MSQARLLSLTLERFKSYRDATTIELAPLTILLGSNNSGKSSIIQALLLLKQTLMQPRRGVSLHLDGPYVDAFSLGELTFGWPRKGTSFQGPSIGLTWASQTKRFFGGEKSPIIPARSFLHLEYAHSKESPISLEHSVAIVELQNGTKIRGRWSDYSPGFIPIHTEENLKDSLADRYENATDDLQDLLINSLYVSSARTPPPSLFRSATLPPEDVGVNGEYAAQLLQTRGSSKVHYLPPQWLDSGPLRMPTHIVNESLVDAANRTMRSLGIEVSLSVEEVGEFGFRLLFGQASIQHVGRGLNHLLPVILQGLLADHMRFTDFWSVPSLDEYVSEFRFFPICAIEEPEIHLHPKVQSRLAHWFVAQAMSGRQMIVETHSDHIVRRLRALAARAEPGSPAEKWLLENVRILNVTQDADGCSRIETLHLTPQGGIENWPANFMDVATQEEQSIYFASLDKPAPEAARTPAAVSDNEIEHDVGDEPDVDK